MVLRADPSGQAALNEHREKALVFVRDSRPERLAVVRRIVLDCGARLREPVATLEEPSEQMAEGCRVALVGLEASPVASTSELELVQLLKQNDVKMICYADGSHSWPLGVQCRVLLAGSLKLLDSEKPDFPSQLRSTLGQILAAAGERADEEARIRSLMNESGIVGKSQGMIGVFRWVLRVSELSDLPTLIMGETGTGKELLARAIHKLDPKRKDGLFIALNCGALHYGLSESELFGHRRGAFTGADHDRKGLVRSASGGVLFLDEIGELDLSVQTKLLRVLQERRVLGLGYDRESPIDVRVISATNRNLEEMVGQGRFRDDLFHRLNVLSIHVPPLRDRPEDVGALIEEFLRRHNRAGLRPVSPGADFVEALSRVDLPGNARQLENLIWRAVVNKPDEAPLGLADLPVEILDQLSQKWSCDDSHSGPPGRPGDAGENDFRAELIRLINVNRWSLVKSLEHCERLLVEAALQLTHGNQTSAATLLGITPRSVYNKLRKHHLKTTAPYTSKGVKEL